MSQYHNSNLLYRPSVSVWTARKKDTAESAKVNSNAGAIEGAANVHKQLLPDSKELEDVQKYATTFRTWIYANTLPWGDNGERIGRAERHLEFMIEVGDRQREFNALVDTFLDAYAQAYENAKFTLNAMFNPADYPGQNEVRSKFSISLDVSTLPNSEDFRVVDGIPQEEVDKLCEVARSSTEARIQAGMTEAYTRLFDVVSKMATTLAQYGDKQIKKFNDTLVHNIGDLIGIMPALNITGDPKLAALTTECRVLLDYDLTDLRKNDVTRRAAIKDARALVAKFATIMGKDQTVVSDAVGGVHSPAHTLFADMMDQ